MIRFFVSAVLLLAASAPLAARPSTLGMSCRQAQNLVATQGAVVMTTGPHTYQRFVSSPGYCMTAEWAESATAPTKDSRRCSLGYVCTTAPPLWYDNDRDGGLFSGR